MYDSKEYLRELLETGNYIIETHRLLDGTRIYCLGANYTIQYDFKPCVHYSEEIGCEIFDERPEMCRWYEPGATREECGAGIREKYQEIWANWLSYQMILTELRDEKEEYSTPKEIELQDDDNSSWTIDVDDPNFRP